MLHFYYWTIPSFFGNSIKNASCHILTKSLITWWIKHEMGVVVHSVSNISFYPSLISTPHHSPPLHPPLLGKLLLLVLLNSKLMDSSCPLKCLWVLVIKTFLGYSHFSLLLSLSLPPLLCTTNFLLLVKPFFWLHPPIRPYLLYSSLKVTIKALSLRLYHPLPLLRPCNKSL